MDAEKSNAAAGPDWRALLASAVAADPKGKAGVALRLGVSRAYVSRVMSPGSSAIAAPSAHFVTRVLNRFHVVECPATLEMQPRGDCRKALGAAPTHNPLAMRIWRECQRCPNKPDAEEKS